jgi:hypothetical protein
LSIVGQAPIRFIITGVALRNEMWKNIVSHRPRCCPAFPFCDLYIGTCAASGQADLQLAIAAAEAADKAAAAVAAARISLAASFSGGSGPNDPVRLTF